METIKRYQVLQRKNNVQVKLPYCNKPYLRCDWKPLSFAHDTLKFLCVTEFNFLCTDFNTTKLCVWALKIIFRVGTVQYLASEKTPSPPLSL